MTLRHIFKTGLLAASLFVAPLVAQAADPGISANNPAFGAAVHDYLLAHPELLMEMQQALQMKQAAAHESAFKQALPSARTALLTDARDGVVGNPKGDVSIVVFQDKECPYCKALLPEITQLLKDDPNIRVVYKEFPILGTGSMIAAKATVASLKQGKFEEFHNALLADKTPEHQLDEAKIMKIAGSVELNIERLKADMAAPEVATKIADNMALARSLGVNGTPGMIIGDTMDSYVPYDQLKQMVADARASQKHP